MKTINTITKLVPTSFLKLSALALLSAPLLACSTQSEPKTVASNAGCGSLVGEEATLQQVYAPGAVYDAKPIKERIFKARANQPIRTMGASLYVQAQPDMNAPHLRRVLSCHAGSTTESHPNDPLRPQGGQIASIDVREVRHGFAIDILADSPDVGEEIYKRAESLNHEKGSVQVQQVGALDTRTAM